MTMFEYRITAKWRNCKSFSAPIGTANSACVPCAYGHLECRMIVKSTLSYCGAGPFVMLFDAAILFLYFYYPSLRCAFQLAKPTTNIDTP